MLRRLAAAALSLAGLPVYAAEKFPSRPLVGTFELVRSTPDIAGIDPRKLYSEIFQPGQRVRFTYAGIYGADVPSREVYNVELLPPFAPGFCLRPNWLYTCGTGTRAPNENDRPLPGAVNHEAYLDAERLKTDEEVGLLKDFVPYGLKRGSFVYALTYADARASYKFFSRAGTR